MLTDYSVVIPAHNAEAFIAASLASVAKQSLRPREVIVVDDGSADRTGQYAREAGATVIAQKQSLGPSASRNLGVSRCTAPLVAFLDADDEWLPDHAERLVQALDHPGAVFAGSDAVRFGFESGLMTTDFSGDEPVDLRDLLISENPVIQSSVMILREVFDEVGGYDESIRLSEDYELWTRVADRGTFAYVKSPTVRRRMHFAQASVQFRVELVSAWWHVRRRTAARRLDAASAIERESVLRLLTRASHSDVEWAIWTGDSDMLTLVRDELSETDEVLGLKGRLGTVGGLGVPALRLSQDVRCCSRAVLRILKGA